MDTAHWPQEIVVKPIEEIITNSCPKPHTNNIQASSSSLSQGGKINNNNNNNTNLVDMRSSSISKTSMMKPSSQNKDHHQQALNCPRCNSTNTKFCYYNNYSLTQPRYFCKTCRRYWTEGGSLRSIPVGGGSRKNKRSSPSSSSSSSKIIINSRLPDLVHNQLGQAHQAHQAQAQTQAHDLNLGFYPPIINDQKINHIISNPSSNTSPTSTTTTTTTNTSDHFSALELLTGLTSRGFNSFFPIPDFKPSLNFSLDGLGPNTTSATTTTTTNTASAYGSLPSVHENNNSGSGRLLFPFEDLKQVSSQNNNNSGIIDQNNNIIKENGDSTGYWTGMLGGGW